MANILVVDDDPDFVEVTRLILRSAGHTVESASSGKKALSAIKRSAPDLVVLDVMMEGVLDGYHLAQTINSDTNLHPIPIIMVSSIASSSMAGMFPTDEYLPVNAWISKPVQPEDLLRRVARLVGDPSSSS